MQDKSSYSSNKPQISEGLQNFINAMVEDIVLKGEPFNESKKRWLKKYSEKEELNYVKLEANLNDFFELFEDLSKTESKVLFKYYYETADKCYIPKTLAESFISCNPKGTATRENQNDGVFYGSFGGLVGAHLLDM